MHQLGFLLGLTSANHWPYLLWSGIVGDVALTGAGYALLRRHNCHEPRCWRIGRTAIDGRLYCHHHTPTPPTYRLGHGSPVPHR